MKPREYCCCAIPITNAGIYATLLEQIALGVLVGALSFATTPIVAAVTPEFAKVILGIIGFVGAGIQILGIIGVMKEKPTLFRRYLTLHSLITTAGFSVAIAWTVLSATRHSTAKQRCIENFFSDESNNIADAADTICNIFPYVGVGVMGGLILVLAIAQFYFYLVLSSYSSTQERDHIKYDSVALKPNDAYPMNVSSRNDPWDSRPADDQANIARSRTHHRNDSATSASDVLSEPHIVSADGLSTRSYNYGQDPHAQQGYGNYPTRQNSQPASLMHPSNAHTQEPTPTPAYNSNQMYNPYGDNRVGSPPQAQAHPAEGMFGRKTPRAYDDPYYSRP